MQINQSINTGIKNVNRKKTSAKTSQTYSARIVFTVVFILFLVYALFILAPFAYGFSIALKKNGRAFMDNPVSISWPLYFSNFVKALSSIRLNERNTFFTMVINSVWYSAGMSFMSIAACTCVAYVVAKYNFRGKNIIYNGALIIMMIPIYGQLPAQYKLYSFLGLIDSPLLLITAFSGFGANFIYIHAFFKSVPWSYAEAAFIDGASNFRVFISIMVPMMLPSISALSIMAFIGNWNDYQAPLLWLPNMLPLATGLYTYEAQMTYVANQPLYFAGVFVSLIPVLTLFVLFQNTIMTKVYSGGLKG